MIQRREISRFRAVLLAWDMLYHSNMLTIETIGRNGKWIAVAFSILISRTGFCVGEDFTAEELFDQTVNCYPNDDWRLMRGTTEIDSHEAL